MNAETTDLKLVNTTDGAVLMPDLRASAKICVLNAF
jgi:hypothetical protein